MSHHESAARGPDARMVDRMLFFSDAVFAIVLTLLVIELHAPELEETAPGALWGALGEMRGRFGAFFGSFALVGLWWIVHMRATRLLKEFDWTTAWFNLLVLMCIALTPFVTALLGANPGNAGALQAYWGVNTATAFSMTLLFLIMSRGKGRLIGGMGGRERLSRIVQSLAPGIAFLTGIWLATQGQAQLSILCPALIFPITLIGRLLYRAPRAPPARA